MNEKIEPTWTYLNQINTLKKEISNLKSDLNIKIERKETILSNLILSIKADVNKITDASVEDTKSLCSNLTSKLGDLERELQFRMDSLDQEHNQKYIILYNTLEAYKKKIDTLHFDIIDNEDNLSVSYINPDGKLEYGAFKKILPDNKTLKIDDYNKMSIKYNFNPNTFEIKNDDLKATGLSLTTGGYLDADDIQNSIKNADYNISSLKYKLEKLLSKVDSANAYIASNNFKKDTPTQESLTLFAIDCISPTEDKVTVDSIPTGTRIKNTYNNHVWVFNRIKSSDGLTTYKWEDFGSDNICIATNDGTHGLMTGSYDKYKAFIDINGVVSINGLEEDLQDILEAATELTTTVNSLKSDYETFKSDIEERLKRLEENG